ncbi:MAG: competence/damage-inducible protein A [Nitrospirales bacterium]
MRKAPQVPRQAEIIAVGTELLVGGRAETNSLVIAHSLGSLGIDVRFKTVVGDEEEDIAAAVRTALRRADLVIVAGGLGPTRDDLTREGVARATGRVLRRRPDALAALRQRLAAWGRVPSRAHLRQASIPSGAEVLTNPVGTAPGFALPIRQGVIVALPGVPEEAEAMLAQEVVPRLRARWGLAEGIDRRVLLTFGLPESDVDERLHGLVGRRSPVRLGLQASPFGVLVSLTAFHRTSAGREAQGFGLDRLIRQARSRLGDAVVAEGDEPLEAMVGRRLLAQGLTLAVAESCTGGLLGHRLTQIAGSSAYVDRVAVCYSNRAKIEMLGVPEDTIRRFGAVSAEVGSAMAEGVRSRSGTDVGLSVTGIAGPSGGTPEKPVGLVFVGLDWRPELGQPTLWLGRPVTQEYRFHGERPLIKARASQGALVLLYRWLDRAGESAAS